MRVGGASLIKHVLTLFALAIIGAAIMYVVVGRAMDPDSIVFSIYVIVGLVMSLAGFLLIYRKLSSFSPDFIPLALVAYVLSWGLALNVAARYQQFVAYYGPADIPRFHGSDLQWALALLIFVVAWTALAGLIAGLLNANDQDGEIPNTNIAQQRTPGLPA